MAAALQPNAKKAEEPDRQRRAAARLLKVGVSLLCLGALLFGYAAFDLVPLFRGLVSNPAHPVPGEFRQEFEPGDYLISVQVGSNSSAGPLFIRTTNSVEVLDLSVSDPNGDAVVLTSGHNQSVDRNGDSFAGVAVFTADEAGLYSFDVTTSEKTNMLVTHSLTSTSVVAVLLGGIGFLTLSIGLILVIIGLVRLRKHRETPYRPIPA